MFWQGKLCGDSRSEPPHTELVELLLDGDSAIDGEGAVWITAPHLNAWVKFSPDGSVEIGKDE